MEEKSGSREKISNDDLQVSSTNFLSNAELS